MLAQLSPSVTKWNLSQFATIPGCAGKGVVTPFDGRVEVAVCRVEDVRVGATVIDESTITETQTLTDSHKPLQSAPTDGFQAMNCEVLIAYLLAIVPQFSFFTTKWKALQLLAISGWVGMGVLTPFDGVGEMVNVGVLVSAEAFVEVTGSGDGSGSLNASTQ